MQSKRSKKVYIDLKKFSFILFITLLWSTTAMAEVVVLKSGAHVQGEILLQNEEVVIIKKKDGTRYQYPRHEIQSIEKELSSDVSVSTETKQLQYTNKSVAIGIQAHGGTVCLPHKGWGGQVGADLLIGTKKIGNTPILVGGSIGYRSKLFSKNNYSFIPLQAVVSMPLMPYQHAPHIGMSIGYGFSTDKNTNGGICLSASTGWTYQVNPNLALLLSVSAEWQNTQTEITEIIDNQEYKNNVGCNFITIGATIGIQF